MSKCILLLIILAIFTGCKLTEDDLNSIQISNVNLSLVNDGTFEGSYADIKSGRNARVSVIIKNHKIMEVDILEFSASPVGRKGKYVIKSVIKQQSINVDAVSGATISSNILLKSIENALLKGYAD